VKFLYKRKENGIWIKVYVNKYQKWWQHIKVAKTEIISFLKIIYY